MNPNNNNKIVGAGAHTKGVVAPTNQNLKII